MVTTSNEHIYGGGVSDDLGETRILQAESKYMYKTTSNRMHAICTNTKNSDYK